MNYNNKKSNYQGNFYSKKNHYNNKKYNSNFNNYYENNFTNNYDYSGYKRIKIYNNNNNNNNYNANNSYQNIPPVNAYNPNFIYKVELLNNSYLYNNNNNNNNSINTTSNNIKKINNNNYNNNYNINNNNINNTNKKEEIFKIKIKLKNEEKELILYKGEDINNSINKFCSQNKIDNKLIKPIFNKVKYYLEFYENLINKTYLEKEDFDILNKVNLLYNDNKGI